MTGADIKAAVYNLTGDRAWSEDSDSTDGLIINWMNLALIEFPIETTAVKEMFLEDITGKQPVQLPVDFSTIAYYEVNGVTYNNQDLVFTPDNKVIFPIDIELGILYYYPIPVFEGVYEDIPLHEMFHSCLIYFFYAQYYYQSGEGDIEEHRMADNYMARFEILKERAINSFMNKMPERDPMPTKDAMPKLNRRRGSDYDE